MHSHYTLGTTPTNTLKLYVWQVLVKKADPKPDAATLLFRMICMNGTCESSCGNGTWPIDTPAGAFHSKWLFSPMPIVTLAGLVRSATPKTASAGNWELRGLDGVAQSASLGCRRYHTTT